MFKANRLIAGLAIAFVPCGCTTHHATFFVTTASAPVVSTTAKVPLKPLVLAPGESASQQNHDLTVRDLKEVPVRMGKAVEGVVTNRGTRNYHLINLKFEFFDAGGASLGTKSDIDHRFSPGTQWQFRIRMPDESARYKIVELSGQ